ncbi:aldo/keto reductase [Obba rivulosa]|uniref:Aldo/keto reductase n=1 Tax=Obba rivulosa TaxID=1052685 RepID=A0A8E2B5G2_9APHY|nr:aldo/keto reductase [Obba rivulosa]
MVQKTVTIAGSVTVAKVSHGLMRMTGTLPPVSDEVAFEAIKGGVDALPSGVKMFLNGGAFYAPDRGPANLELIARFFEKYPEYADKAFLSIKAGVGANGVDCSAESLRRNMDVVLRSLRGTKRVDLFQPARIDPKVGLEDIMQTLVQLHSEGKFDYIGLTECSAVTLRRAHAIHPIAVAEIEISPFSYEDETKRVIATAKELGIAIAAYAPLGAGLLTGTMRSPSDLPEGDMRCIFSRFQEDNMHANLAIVDALTAVAERKHIALGQLCIAWVGQLGDHVIPLPGSSNKKRTLENLEGGNIDISSEELKEIEQILQTHRVKGERYFGAEKNEQLYLWG